MTWSYSHPRLISYIRAMPVPFNVSGERTEEVETRVNESKHDKTCKIVCAVRKLRSACKATQSGQSSLGTL